MKSLSFYVSTERKHMPAVSPKAVRQREVNISRPVGVCSLTLAWLIFVFVISHPVTSPCPCLNA